MVRARGACAVLAIVVHNTKVHGGIPPLHGRPGIQFKHHRQSSYRVALVGGAPAIWFSLNEVRTRSENFAGGQTLNGTECSNQGPSQTLNGMERSVRGVRGLNLSSELNFSITKVCPVTFKMGDQVQVYDSKIDMTFDTKVKLLP